MWGWGGVGLGRCGDVGMLWGVWRSGGCGGMLEMWGVWRMVGDGGVVGRGGGVLRHSVHSGRRYAVHPAPISER